LNAIVETIYANSTPPQTSITPHLVAQLFPATPLANIAANLPHVLDALTAAGLADTLMLLVALATIRAEAEPFLPLTEQPCHYNTSPNGSPFDLYDRRKDLGNLAPPDGATFRGRGFVQLTGRANYAQFAREINQPLLTNPDLAADPAIAAQLLARFLSHKESAIRHALAANDLAAARRLVNGGSNGLDRFVSAFHIGAEVLKYQNGPNHQSH
jgi:peptidoglycan L-alanyl-D-glutamate endopeptidase CwlK